MPFADRLKDLRTKAKMSQAELAEKLGLTQGAIGHWESGARDGPSPDEFLSLCDALGVDCSAFRDDAKPAKKPRKK